MSTYTHLHSKLASAISQQRFDRIAAYLREYSRLLREHIPENLLKQLRCIQLKMVFPQATIQSIVHSRRTIEHTIYRDTGVERWVASWLDNLQTIRCQHYIQL